MRGKNRHIAPHQPVGGQNPAARGTHQSKAKIAIIKVLTCIVLATWVCGVLFLTQLGLSFILSWLNSLIPFYIPSSLLQTIYAFLSYTVAFIIITVLPPLIFKKFHVTKTDLGLNELPTWTDIGLAIVGLFAYLVLAALVTALFSSLSWFNANEAQDVGFNTLILASDRIFAFITLVIVAPIAEELIFRGALYSRVKSLFFKNPKVLPEQTNKTQITSSKSKRTFKTNRKELVAIAIATFITSVAFGAMHGQWNVGVNVFAMSIVLCLMREITGSIYSGILMHMLKNMIAFYVLYIAQIGF